MHAWPGQLVVPADTPDDLDAFGWVWGDAHVPPSPVPGIVGVEAPALAAPRVVGDMFQGARADAAQSARLGDFKSRSVCAAAELESPSLSFTPGNINVVVFKIDDQGWLVLRPDTVAMSRKIARKGHLPALHFMCRVVTSSSGSELHLTCPFQDRVMRSCSKSDLCVAAVMFVCTLPVFKGV